MNIDLPASKSIGARYLVATYFAGTLPADPVFDDSEDLMVLQQALLSIYSDEEPIDYGDSPIDVNASGTAYRFVTAVCASCPGADYVVTGIPRLMSRPITPLTDLLKEAGAKISTLGLNGDGPLRITGNNIEGGEFTIRGDISSQFISAVMLVAPSWKKGVHLNFSTPLVSKPYLQMTEQLMKKFGIQVSLNDKFVDVKPGKYVEPEGFKVEADWSGASFFYEACALSGKTIDINDLVSPYDSLQGDSITVGLFTLLGVESDFKDWGVSIDKNGETKDYVEFDFTNCPDLFLPFAVACLFSEIKFNFKGVKNLRIKESDRLASLKDEARKFGFVVKLGEDTAEWDGEKVEARKDAVVDPHNDHRVAMSFAMAALKTGQVKISHPEVVEKSFVNFWQQIENIGIKCDFSDNFVIVRFPLTSNL